MADLLYLDSSALVKLVLPEPETPALLELLADWPYRISSEIAAVEVVRAARRASDDAAVHGRAREVIAAVNLIRIDADVLGRATSVEPKTLRTLDALHLASALRLRGDTGAMAVYDVGLAAAARKAGLTVLQPST